MEDLQVLRDNLATLAIIAGSCMTIAAFLGVLVQKVIRPCWRALREFNADLLATIARIRWLVDLASRELQPNGGASMKDQVRNINSTLERHINDMKIHRIKTEIPPVNEEEVT